MQCNEQRNKNYVTKYCILPIDTVISKLQWCKDAIVHTMYCRHVNVFSHISRSSLCAGPAIILVIQYVRYCVMSSVSWYFFMSPFTLSLHLFFDRPLLLLPETSSLSDFAQMWFASSSGQTTLVFCFPGNACTIIQVCNASCPHSTSVIALLHIFLWLCNVIWVTQIYWPHWFIHSRLTRDGKNLQHWHLFYTVQFKTLHSGYIIIINLLEKIIASLNNVRDIIL